MANYQKTQDLFNSEPNRAPGFKYEKSGEQLAEEKQMHTVSFTDGKTMTRTEKQYKIG